MIILISKLMPKEKPHSYSHSKISNNLSQIFEKTLRDYESRIIANLGEGGDAAFLDGDDAKKGEIALKKFALNTVLSDRMPLDRKLRDPRNKK